MLLVFVRLFVNSSREKNDNVVPLFVFVEVGNWLAVDDAAAAADAAGASAVVHWIAESLVNSSQHNENDCITEYLCVSCLKFAIVVRHFFWKTAAMRL